MVLGGYAVSVFHLDSLSVRQDLVSHAVARLRQIGRALAALDFAALRRGGVAVARPLPRHRQNTRRAGGRAHN